MKPNANNMSQTFWERISWFEIIVVGGMLIFFFLALIIWPYIKAVKQQEVYRRSGVEMSLFEVWLDCKPLEREVRIKEEGK